MTITICGSIKFIEEMRSIEKRLINIGHKVYMPVKAPGVDYWEKDNSKRVIAKRGLGLIEKHLDKIEISDAILVVNVDKLRKKNYVGANTFTEICFARYRKKKIYFLNPIPRQSYILDELQSIDPVILNGDLSKIK